MNVDHFLFVEKYRPQTIDECILPERLKVPFKEYVKQQQIPNLLLCGGPGVGKTTVAKAMAREIGSDLLVINGSDESGIDVFRTKIKHYASSMSLNGGRKIILIDEADYLNCFSGEQEICVIENGVTATKKIDELIGQQIQILSYSFSKKEMEITDGYVVSSGEQEVFEVEFEDGTTMLCTKDHPFFTDSGEQTTINSSEFLFCINSIEADYFNKKRTQEHEGVYISSCQ